MQNSIKILHISPHLGGGVGSVLINYLIKVNSSKEYKHSIYCFDSINENAKKYLHDENIIYEENISKQMILLLNKISDVDIIVIHWWNHPLLYEFMIKNKLPPSRVIIWSHVSGLNAPQLFTKNLFDYPDYFVFTTPISYKSKEFITYKGNKSKFLDIWSTGGFKRVQDIKHAKQKEFTIGYIGTIDFAKLHPDFLEICKRINIPNMKFIICGDGCHLNILKEEIKKQELQEKFEFVGYVNDIKPYLEKFDLFLYPLNPKHYGTCDQALTEAMASGIVPAVLNNDMESYIVHNSYTGIVAISKKDLVLKIEKLYKNIHERERISKNTKKEALRRFELTTTIEQWNKLYLKILEKKKTKKKWNNKIEKDNITAFYIFCESIKKHSHIFEINDKVKIKKLLNSNSLWQSKTKGTPQHYAEFFPKDKKIKEICGLIND